ncbi:MAG: metallopeptidase TldD-related protein [Jatrophihabitantaceae bacterium]
MMSTGIQQLVERALSLSTADGCIVLGEEHTQANLRWAANGLTTNGQSHAAKLTVISVVRTPDGDACGVVSRPIPLTDSLAELAALVAASERAAREASPADDAAELVRPYANADDWSAPAAKTGIEVFSDFAPALAAAFDQARAEDTLLYGYAEHAVSSVFLASSTGLRRRHDQPTGRVELNAKSADLSRTAWVGQHTRDFTDLAVPDLVADLRRRLDWARNQLELPPGRYQTLLPPTAVADLMIYAYWTMSSRDAEEGRSVFAAKGGGTRIGERLGELPLTLRSDPDWPGCECAPFQIMYGSGDESVFDNGMPVRATDWIADGTLRNLFRSRNWAARSGAEFRAAIENLILTAPAATKSLDEMIASTERGLLVTCLWYIREVDPQALLLTGLTRDGVYLIEDGQVRGVVNNFRFNESPVDLLSRVTEVGRPVQTLPREWALDFARVVMPTLRVDDFNMSTVSQAS